jgi:hypothetical protein
MYEDVEVKVHIFLIALNECESSDSCSNCFTHRIKPLVPVGWTGWVLE